MKVFLSWSGERSKQVATLLDEWLRCVLQAIRPWISTKDIDRGALWFSEIQDQLQDTTTGIICLTQENKERPWILFEAGALAKGLSNARVCTLLVDIKPSEIKDPLAQLNHTRPDRENMFELVRTLNSRLVGNSLDPRILETVFDTYWEQFETEFNAILSRTKNPEAPVPRSDQDILSEILDITRALGNRVSAIEKATLTQAKKIAPPPPPQSKMLVPVDQIRALGKSGHNTEEISVMLRLPTNLVQDALDLPF